MAGRIKLKVAAKKYCSDNYSVVAVRIKLKLLGTVPSFAFDKKIDRTWSVGHGL